MSTRRARRSDQIEDLRRAIECLPVHTRVAMLEGVRSNDIIVGAYVDRTGGVCPMLAAHRCGGRTDFLAFARSWDRFTGAHGRARRASERELRVLVTHLEASLLADSHVDLQTAIAEHRTLVEQRTTEPMAIVASRAEAGPRTGDRDRRSELRDRRGWAWLRPFRRLDDYERALARLESQRAAPRDPAAADVNPDVPTPDREPAGV